MKILITGGAGFLGFHLAQYLQKKKFDLTLVDVHNFDSHEYEGSFKLEIADIRDAKKIDKLIKGHDIVIHCAAALPLWKKEDIYSVNIEGTKNVLEASLHHKIKRVIHISSTAVYGIPKKHPIVETDPLQGVGPYGESKIQAEELCLSFIEKGLPVTILRPKTFVGTGRLGVFEILFDWVHDGKKIPVFGSGNNRYQLLDVDDLVEVVYLFIDKSTVIPAKAGIQMSLRAPASRQEAKQSHLNKIAASPTAPRNDKLNDVFNIGAEEFTTVKKDLTALFTFAQSGSKVLPIPSLPLKLVLRFFELLHLSPLYQWVYETADKDSFVSINKIVKTLDWKPKYSNAEALIKAYKWYLENYSEIKSHPAGVTHTAGWKQGVLGLVKRFL